jgi:hypothetical protein
MVEGYILPLDCPIVTVKDEANFSIPFCSPFVIGLVLRGEPAVRQLPITSKYVYAY